MVWVVVWLIFFEVGLQLQFWQIVIQVIMKVNMIFLIMLLSIFLVNCMLFCMFVQNDFLYMFSQLIVIIVLFQMLIMLKIVVSSGMEMKLVYRCGVMMYLSGLILIIFRLESCLVVFMLLIFVVSVELVWLVNSRLVIIGFSLCSRVRVIICLIVCLELQEIRMLQFCRVSIMLMNRFEMMMIVSDSMFIEQSCFISRCKLVFGVCWLSRVWLRNRVEWLSVVIMFRLVWLNRWICLRGEILCISVFLVGWFGSCGLDNGMEWDYLGFF